LVSSNALRRPDCGSNCFDSLAFAGDIIAGVGNVTVKACGFLNASVCINDAVTVSDLEAAVGNDLDFVGQRYFF
jgi:hypothetical protein